MERAEQVALRQSEPADTFEWFKVDRGMGNVRNQGYCFYTQASLHA